jgi:hypothetical protein
MGLSRNQMHNRHRRNIGPKFTKVIARTDLPWQGLSWRIVDVPQGAKCRWAMIGGREVRLSRATPVSSALSRAALCGLGEAAARDKRGGRQEISIRVSR